MRQGRCGETQRNGPSQKNRRGLENDTLRRVPLSQARPGQARPQSVILIPRKPPDWLILFGQGSILLDSLGLCISVTLSPVTSACSC